VINITKNAPKRGIFSLYNSINCRKIKATNQSLGKDLRFEIKGKKSK